MQYQIIPVTPFQQNCSLIWSESSGQAALIDPGGEPERLMAEVQRRDLQLERILLTHGHIDHIGGAGILAAQLGLPIHGPQKADEFLFENLPAQCEMFGFPKTQPFLPDVWLEEGMRVSVGDIDLEVIHCPGHTPGHVVFLEASTRLAFVGDVLFYGSIGRTDFPRGNHPALIHSIQAKLFPLGDDIRFVPGHGPMSTFGHERRTNPFVGEFEA